VTEVDRKQPETVHESDKQSGEERPQRWWWTEPALWKSRMLETLERGVRGGKWFSLIDKVYSEDNLRAAYRRVRRNKGAPGIDHETVKHYERRLEENLATLQERLRSSEYEPSAVRRVYIPKPGKLGKRPLGIPTVVDRIVQAAVCNAIEPIFEREFKDCSYGFRPQKSTKEALRTVKRKLEEGHRHVVDADIQSFFDTIDHTILMELVERHIADGRVLKLIEQFLKQGVLEEGNTWVPEAGTPQGGVISPLLANIYLHEVDVALSEEGYTLVRYADDLVILCDTAEKAKGALEALHRITQRLALTLHPEKTKIVDMNEPGARFTFLGYDFVNAKRDRRIRTYPSKKSKRNLHMRMRELTSRTNGHSMSMIIERVNCTLRGWFEYFKHSPANALEAEDGYVRRRLRAILAKRNGKHNRGYGLAQTLWPNRYFHAAGLFSTVAARCYCIQSA
jgi:RNA-directed DNA polymerase